MLNSSARTPPRASGPRTRMASTRARMPRSHHRSPSSRFTGQLLTGAEQMAKPPSKKSEAPRQSTHVKPLEQRPLPGVSFAAYDRDRADALQGEDIENH